RDRRAAGRALVPVDPQPSEDAPSPAATATAPLPGDPAFSAQLLGQTGQRRGLKGGPPVLDAARSGYLRAQHSGPGERRPKPGTVTKSEA
ncbi:MAG: hypothetical protein KJ861_05970, partial [Alphaproteobacteria bacterium]|nr:hypothetical protein [Alphaproteobacteria bacterium]